MHTVYTIYNRKGLIRTTVIQTFSNPNPQILFIDILLYTEWKIIHLVYKYRIRSNSWNNQNNCISDHFTLIRMC